MLRRRHLPALAMPVTAARAGLTLLGIRVAPGAEAAFAALAARLQDTSLRLVPGAAGECGALAFGARPAGPALLPFAGFPCGMAAAELRHWLGTADGQALWAAGFARRGLHAFPLAAVTRAAPPDSPAPGCAHGAVVELALPPAVLAGLPAACRAALEAACAAAWAAAETLPTVPALAPPAAAESVQRWWAMVTAAPEATALRLAERYRAARLAALFGTLPAA
ncbi:hypothetical protein JYK14_19830 [Siccirubricoccus sp. KC 17139]|uniref:Uncharacterized protein n=1 Tax=Siccirubricoccus soli TaxID=2899147 RepID=A0ABT1D914_9PROT|nr:hypothetical protein [Siccirubricoccus soli]MCO6418396.1 hypothetical protein [Siccirubricoccus soli]MCP2684531.1 hypothetical protein [Siccirubricoccus soli]